MNVFMYWVGPKPKLIEELLRLASLHSGKCTLHLITSSNLNDYLSVPAEFHALNPSYQSDYIRYNVIEKYGGVWVDADTIVMQQLDKLFENFGANGFLVEIKGALRQYGQNTVLLDNSPTIYTGMFGSASNTQFITTMAQMMREALASPRTGVFLMPKGFNHPIDDLYLQRPELFTGYKILNGAETVFPSNWWESEEEFLSKPFDNHLNLTREYQPAICLVKGVYQKAEQIWDRLDKAPLSYFLKKADSGRLRE